MSGAITYGIPASQAALDSLASQIPQPASISPPAVADSSALGTPQGLYALANHTHASKVRRERVQCAADGTLTWTFSTPFGAGVVPRCFAVAEVATGVTDVVNVQVVDTPTNTQCKFLVNRTNRSVVSLIGLTVLSVPTQPGVTWVHVVAIEP